MAPVDSPAGGHALVVEVIYCVARGEVDRSAVTLPVGATVQDALFASGLLRRHPGLDPAGAGAGAGIWGRLAEPGQLLRAGDRVEVYRPLLIEPKEARRQRQHRQRRKNAAAAMRVQRP